jgi:hypothetical protein
MSFLASSTLALENISMIIKALSTALKCEQTPKIAPFNQTVVALHDYLLLVPPFYFLPYSSGARIIISLI